MGQENKKRRNYIKGLKEILGEYGVHGKTLNGKDKKNEFLDKFLKAIEDQIADQILGYAKQLAFDAFLIVMRRHGHGPKKCRELATEFQKALEEFDLCAETEAVEFLRFNDVKPGEEPDIIYTKDSLDEAVKPLYGDSFKPYDIRFKEAQNRERHHNWTELREMAKND